MGKSSRNGSASSYKGSPLGRTPPASSTGYDTVGTERLPEHEIELHELCGTKRIKNRYGSFKVPSIGCPWTKAPVPVIPLDDCTRASTTAPSAPMPWQPYLRALKPSSLQRRRLALIQVVVPRPRAFISELECTEESKP